MNKAFILSLLMFAWVSGASALTVGQGSLPVILADGGQEPADGGADVTDECAPASECSSPGPKSAAPKTDDEQAAPATVVVVDGGG